MLDMGIRMVGYPGNDTKRYPLGLVLFVCVCGSRWFGISHNGNIVINFFFPVSLGIPICPYHSYVDIHSLGYHNFSFPVVPFVVDVRSVILDEFLNLLLRVAHSVVLKCAVNHLPAVLHPKSDLVNDIVDDVLNNLVVVALADSPQAR